MTIKYKRLIAIILTVSFFWLISFIAMQFTDEVNWNVFDFIIAAGLLFGMGLLIERVIRNVKKPSYRMALIITLLIILFIVWGELAVGIFGTPFAGN